MTIDVEGSQKATVGLTDDPVAASIMEALDQKGTLDVVELVSIVNERPQVIKSTLEQLLAANLVQVTEQLDGLRVFRLTRPLHSGFYRI